MTHDEIRALIGGYATGSLTETERRALFEAALDDQELFDELAREQDLKEIIDQPGARERLIRSIARERNRAWWQRPLPWIALAASAAAIVIMMWRPQRPAEVVKLEAPRIEAPPVLPPQSPTPRAKTLQEATSQEKTERVQPPPVSPAIRNSPFAPRDQTPLPARAPAPKEPAPALSTGVVGGMVDIEKKDAAKAGTAGAPIPPAAALERREMPLAAPMGARAAPSKVIGSLAAPFGFHYAIDWAGDAVITANSDGYLSAAANQTAILPSAAVRAGSTTRVRVPPGSDSILIEFTALPRDASLQTAPVTSTTESTGTIADPAPSGNSKLRVRIASR